MNKLYSIILASLVALALGCNGDENNFSVKPSLGFAATSGSVLESNSTGVRIGFYSNVAITEPVTVRIQVNNVEELTYGIDFTTDPEPVDGVITVTIDPEDDQPSFFVIPSASADDLRNINFQIIDVSGNNLSLGQSTTLFYTLSITGFQPTTIFHDFNGCTTDFNTPTGFVEVFEPGTKTDRGWGCRAFGVGASRAPRASAFGGSAGEDRAWMIMNPVNVPAGATVTITFSTFSQFSGPGVVNVKWSNNYSGAGNPLAATWNTLPTLDSQFPAVASQVWTTVTGSFTNISGNTVYLAFVYTGGLSSASSSWDIDNLTVKVE